MNVRCAVICPIATGGGITESFFTSIEILAAEVRSLPSVSTEIVWIGSSKGILKSTGSPDWRAVVNCRAPLQSLAIARVVRKASVDLVVLNNGRRVACQRHSAATSFW